MNKKVGILWGGGLGDLLVIQPFLKALQTDPSIQSFLLTNATHMRETIEEFCSPTRVIQLPRGDKCRFAHLPVAVPEQHQEWAVKVSDADITEDLGRKSAFPRII